jgi:hypothetical protein
MQPKEQMLVYAFHDFSSQHHEFGVWCAVSARRVGAGALFFKKKKMVKDTFGHFWQIFFFKELM